MGNNEAEKPSKTEKPSSPHQGQNNAHMYPDWAAVQAYYGSGAVPAPYYNPAVTSGVPPHPYMWVPPQMMHPYGSPYAAIYPHGGIYGQSPAPIVATPLSAEPPTRSSGDDSGSAKKLKESGGQSNALGNGNTESGGEAGTHGHSQSGDSGTEGSCERSEGSTSREVRNGDRHDGGDAGKHGSQVSPYPALEPTATGAVHVGIPKASSMSLQVGFQDDKEVKREKRKQSNRESARRSRLRKQAEMEELGTKVESLTVENLALRSQINQLMEDSEKLRSENSAIMDKLGDSKGETNNSGPEGGEDENQSKTEISTENFLSKVENATSNGIAHHQADG